MLHDNFVLLNFFYCNSLFPMIMHTNLDKYLWVGCATFSTKKLFVGDKFASWRTPAIHPTFEVQLKSSFLVHECTHHTNPYQMIRLFLCSDNVANNVRCVLELTSASSST